MPVCRGQDLPCPRLFPQKDYERFVAADGTAAWVLPEDACPTFAFSGPEISGGLGGISVPGFLLQEQKLQYPADDPAYAEADSSEPPWYFQYSPAGGQLPFWAEYDGDWQAYLASGEGAVWRDTIVPWAQLNENAVQVVLTDDVMTTFNFNTGTASILTGRLITPQEYADGAPVCLVSAYLAKYNGWQVGDTVSLDYYTVRMDENEMAFFETGKTDTTCFERAWRRLPILPEDRIGVQKDYIIAGIYTAPEYSEGDQNFTADTVFMPKASVPKAEKYENAEVNYCSALVLENGTEKDFEACMAQKGGAGRFAYCDQNYASVHGTYAAQNDSAGRLFALGLLLFLLGTAVFEALQLRRFSPAVRTARLLGVSRLQVGAELMATLLMQAAAAAAAGLGLALASHRAAARMLVGSLALKPGAVCRFALGLFAALAVFTGVGTVVSVCAGLMRRAGRLDGKTRKPELETLLRRRGMPSGPAENTETSQTMPQPAGRERASAGRPAAVLRSFSRRVLRRRRGMALLLAVLALAGSAGTLALNVQIERQQAVWQKSVRETPISCTVTDAFGSRQERLDIPLEELDALLTGGLEPLIRNLRARSSEKLKTPQNYKLRRIYGYSSEPELRAEDIVMADGWDDTAFQTAERVCLVPKGTAVVSDAAGTPYVNIVGQEGVPCRLQVIGVVVNGEPDCLLCSAFYAEHRRQSAAGGCGFLLV